MSATHSLPLPDAVRLLKWNLLFRPRPASELYASLARDSPYNLGLTPFFSNAGALQLSTCCHNTLSSLEPPWPDDEDQGGEKQECDGDNRHQHKCTLKPPPVRSMSPSRGRMISSTPPTSPAFQSRFVLLGSLLWQLMQFASIRRAVA